MLACALFAVVVVAVVTQRAAFSGAAGTEPFTEVGAIDVFPVEPPCYYSDTWGAPRGGGRQHQGVDIIAKLGQPIYAVRDGKVTKKYFHAARAGNAVQITASDKSYYFYAHLDHWADGIEVGVKVKAGDLIGFVGRTGNTFIPHLHFEIHPAGGAAVNPTPFVAAVDRCGYKPKPPPTTTTVKSTIAEATTVAPTTVATTEATTVAPTTATTVATTVAPTTATTVATTTATTVATTVATTSTTLEPTTTTASTPPPSGDPPAGESAAALRLADTTFKAGIKTRVKVSPTSVLPSGLVEADIKIVASDAKTRGTLVLGDCDHKGKSVLALVPGKKTVTTVMAGLSGSGHLCVTTSVAARLQIGVRGARTADQTRLTVADSVTVFDSEATGRLPSPSNVYKVHLAGHLGIPEGADQLLLWVSGTADRPAVVNAGKCGGRRTGIAEITPGDTSGTGGWLRVSGSDFCIGATRTASVQVEVVGYATGKTDITTPPASGDQTDTTEATTTVSASTTTTAIVPPTTRSTTTAAPPTTGSTTTTGPPTSAPAGRTKAAKLSAPSLELADATFKAGVTTKVKVSPSGVLPPGLERADLKFTASGATTRGTVVVDDCTDDGDSVLKLVPGSKNVATLVAPLSNRGYVCVTPSADARLVISVRGVWTKSGRKVTVSKSQTVFDTAATGRFPAPGDIFKVRLDGSQGVPSGVEYVLMWVSGSADESAVVTAGPCGGKRTDVAEVGAGRSRRTAAWVRVSGKDLCLGATKRASVVVEVVGFG